MTRIGFMSHTLLVIQVGVILDVKLEALVCCDKAIFEGLWLLYVRLRGPRSVVITFLC